MSPILTPFRMSGLAAGLVTVMVRLAVPPEGMLAGVNVLVTLGGA